MPQEGPADEVGGVGEPHPPLTGRRLGQPGPQFVVEDVLLDDGIGRGRHAPGLAEGAAQLF